MGPALQGLRMSPAQTVRASRAAHSRVRLCLLLPGTLSGQGWAVDTHTHTRSVSPSTLKNVCVCVRVRPCTYVDTMHESTQCVHTMHTVCMYSIHGFPPVHSEAPVPAPHRGACPCPRPVLMTPSPTGESWSRSSWACSLAQPEDVPELLSEWAQAHSPAGVCVAVCNLSLCSLMPS